jgi:hypothetical protein
MPLWPTRGDAPARRTRGVLPGPRGPARTAVPAGPGPGPAGPVTAPSRVAGPGAAAAGYRRARFSAESTARSEAVTVFASMPTPHQTRPPISHSTYAAAWASLPGRSACSA